jgi:hypothetical protein
MLLEVLLDMNTWFCHHIIHHHLFCFWLVKFLVDYKEKPCCLVLFSQPVQNNLYEFSQKVIEFGNCKGEHGQCLKDIHVQFSNLPVKYMFQFLQALTVCIVV